VQVRVVAVHDFSTGETLVARYQWSYRGIWATCAKKGLGKTEGKKRLANMFRTSE